MSAERAASLLREAHPDADPFDVEWSMLAEWVAAVGVDPEDDALVASTLVAWERLIG